MVWYSKIVEVIHLVLDRRELKVTPLMEMLVFSGQLYLSYCFCPGRS
jgi:hypothetical protein